MSTHAIRSGRAALVSAYLVRLALFTALWIILTDGALFGWAVAAVTIVAASLASLAFRASTPALSLRGIIGFVPYFLLQSFRGGVDVARRALLPSLPIDPGIETIELRLPSEHQRAILAAVVGLLPGTLSVRLDGRQVHVHALNRQMPVRVAVHELEERMAAVFGVEVSG